jgi:hypothetical protein
LLPIPKSTTRPEIINIAGFALLGLLLSLQPIALLGYFLILNFYYFYHYFKTFNVNILIHLLIFLPSIELLARVLRLESMPSETGKYFCLFYFILFSLDKRVHTKKINTIFIVMFLFLLPSLLFIDIYNLQKKIVFNLLGIINLALLGIFFSRITITLVEFKTLFKNFIYSIIPLLIILTIKTPKFSEIDFKLGANFDTSGGFGPNQVATVIGAGIFILFINQIVFKTKFFSSNRHLDLFFIVALTFRALLTFSRGGLFSPSAAIILPINLLSKVQNIQKIIGNFMLLILFSGFAFLLVNGITGGVLSQRFSGETVQTISGKEDKTIEGFTTGRNSIIKEDIQLWLDNIVFGVGAGESPYKRAEIGEERGANTHTEFSRLLSEHGLFGLVVNILLIIIIPFKILTSKLSPQIKYIKLSFILFALFSMTHSAMRTIIPVIFYAFSAVNFYEVREGKGRIKGKVKEG